MVVANADMRKIQVLVSPEPERGGGVHNVAYTLGGEQKVTFLTEAGIIRLMHVVRGSEVAKQKCDKKWAESYVDVHGSSEETFEKCGNRCRNFCATRE